MAPVETPPTSAQDLAGLIAGKELTDTKPLKSEGKPKPKKPVTEAKPPEKLPVGRMGDPCKLKDCNGRLTDMSRAILPPTKNRKRTTVITLICNTCNKVQGQAEIVDV